MVAQDEPDFVVYHVEHDLTSNKVHLFKKQLQERHDTEGKDLATLDTQDKNT